MVVPNPNLDWTKLAAKERCVRDISKDPSKWYSKGLQELEEKYGLSQEELNECWNYVISGISF